MTADVQQNAATEQHKPSDKELNFEKIRKQLEQEKAEKAKIQERLEALERAQRTTKPSDDDDVSDEPYIDEKRLSKTLSKFESRMEEKSDKKAEEKARILLEQYKQEEYIKKNPDFAQVLNPESIQKFADEHPQIAERMLRMPDNFDRQALLYEQMKTFQAAKKAAEQPSIQQKIDQNRRSPTYHPSGVGTSPYAAAGDFSPSGQKASYEKLQELKSRLRL